MSAYDDLSGARGAKIFFRSKRYRARELITRFPAVLLVDRASHELRDMSMNGISFFGPADAYAVGQTCCLSLRLDEVEVYAGEGVVSRLELTAKGSIVGVGLTRGFLDIPGIVRRHDDLALQRDLSRGASETLELVPQSYRALCAEMLFVLRHSRLLCEQTANAAASEGLSNLPTTGLDEFYARLEAEWTPLRHRAERFVAETDRESATYNACKRLTQTLVTPEFLQGVAGFRGYKKPLGYPGDFILMNAFYAQQFEGNTDFGKLTHKLIAEFPLAACVIPRMEMLAEAIASALHRRAATAEKGPVRVASLGSGPAREVQVFLDRVRPALPIHITLIDQDEAALSHAYHAVFPLLAQLDNGSRVECLHVSFAQLLKDAAVLGALAPQDLIYSAGLVDYLDDAVANRVFSMLYRQLGPSGTLAVGNMADNPGIGWLPEFLLDWPLIYRSEEQMRALGASLDPARVAVRLDRTGHTYIVYVDAPA